eukprot:CAMPEP_0185735684 /NCGR_PEP_ID=MMETSP1171-20130828/25950_1 /TAXON_ID=374046 /ORGANISM="Helicotheca tamensis, Strain CCMP826" /LENGTH=39 /DNA_ID= /DNA_START= /DNA_END= /DNA_ORIENTATION=
MAEVNINTMMAVLKYFVTLKMYVSVKEYDGVKTARKLGG